MAAVGKLINSRRTSKQHIQRIIDTHTVDSMNTVGHHMHRDYVIKTELITSVFGVNISIVLLRALLTILQYFGLFCIHVLYCINWVIYPGYPWARKCVIQERLDNCNRWKKIECY